MTGHVVERGIHPSENARPGAASCLETEWEQLDWNRIGKQVHRLQVRIAKATVEGRWNKVHALQRLLTHSFSGKAFAVKRVSENRGRRTPGIDGITWKTPAQKATAIHKLRQRGYHPRPLRRVYIPKSNGTMRPLGIPTMADRAMQALYLLALLPIAETTGDRSSYGFRPQRSAADAMQRCFLLLAHRTAPRWILEGDIESCFDRIDHEWLLTHVHMEHSVLRKWLKAGFMEASVLYSTDEGTPQGGIASPVLANLALDGLEELLREHFPPRRRCMINLARYADDFIVTGATAEILTDEVQPLIERFLAERGLRLSPSKTVVTKVDTGFDFLGQTVRKYGEKLIIRPSRKSVHTLLDDVRAIIRRNATASAGDLVEQLNPKIRGWTYYHRHVCSGKCFSSVDNAIWHAVWRWALRRHPTKSRTWIMKKYFIPYGGRAWVLTGEVETKFGSKETVRLFAASSVSIRRHRLIRGAANPFDPAWTLYFQSRSRSQKSLPRPTDGALEEA